MFVLRIEEVENSVGRVLDRKLWGMVYFLLAPRLGNIK